MEHLLEADGLGKRYGGRWALRDCTFELPAGRVAALVGPNGAGKSTLLHLAVGLQRPDAGRVRVFGTEPYENTTAAGHPPDDLDPGHQPPALGAGQGRPARRHGDGVRPGLRPGRGLVVRAAGPGRPARDPVHRGLLRPPGRGAGRLHAVRGGPRHLRRHGAAPGAAGDGPDPGRLRGGPGHHGPVRPAALPDPAGREPARRRRRRPG